MMKKKKIKRARYSDPKKPKKRVYPKQIRIVSSGCSHKNISYPGYGGGRTWCSDCGCEKISVWVRDDGNALKKKKVKKKRR